MLYVVNPYRLRLSLTSTTAAYAIVHRFTIRRPVGIRKPDDDGSSGTCAPAVVRLIRSVKFRAGTTNTFVPAIGRLLGIQKRLNFHNLRA